MQEANGFLSFFGRFHPLFVHLPIGFLILAVILEGIKKWKPGNVYAGAIPLVWFLGALSAIFSVITGLILSGNSSYDEGLLFSHKIAGIILAACSTVCFLLYALPFTSRNKIVGPIKTATILLTAILLVLTGHWGGSLTHGNDYLIPVSPSALNDNPSLKRKIKELDSADIFNDAVMPVLQSKCVSCHNSEKKKGGLLLTSYEDILKGGKTREGIIPGNTATSEIFRRITLPKKHKEFMPTDGKTPLTESQVAILEYWIESGAHQQMMIADLKPHKKIEDILNEFFGIGRDAILSYNPGPAKKEDVIALLNDGYQVFAIKENSNLLDVKYSAATGKKPDLKLLLALKEQLVWLQLPNCNLSDEEMKDIGQLANLYKLNLNRNSITDAGVVSLNGLAKLEYLNLYGTAVSDTGVTALAQLPALKKLYVWETRVDSARVQPLLHARKGLEIVYRLTP
jgi:uncharacterized membrane protein